MNVHQSIELHDIRVVPGVLGTLELQGVSAEARAMCSALLSSIRCGARLTGIRCVIELIDAEAVVVESAQGMLTQE
jgi:hypothetical protein